MKRPNIRFFLLCLALLALPGAGQAASQSPACAVVQAAGLSLAERHAAAKASAEAALVPAPHCADGAVRVMTNPDSDGSPLQLHDRNGNADGKPAQGDSSRADGRCAARDGCTVGVLTELPIASLAHYGHAAAMASTAVFAGPLSGFPALP
ncbi:hypothetical protein LMG31506_01527 [Cupriavidus yeoncheonensis]|uniref:Uncharacterized protein n=1 Tax=Cupriavidus yeoncheonensis TaxID=1462994 RepID=A0A916MWW2_9BURK|nr:hypothetical protein [Cupriavidus yeoncheonensis]CAG2135331.1 hypothetical protein LMG31506_01527 [Cupriavidus yeoncheonensis]